MAELGTFGVAVGDYERSNVFVSLNEGWTNAEGRTMEPYVGVVVLGPKGEDGKRHPKAKGGYASFAISRIPGLIAALQAALETAQTPVAETTEDEAE